MESIGSTKIKINKTENGGNVPYLEITNIVLANCNIGKNSYEI